VRRTVGLYLLAAALMIGAAFGNEFKVDHHARALQPGEVVMLSVVSAVPILGGAARVEGKTFPFLEVKEPAPVRHVLVGLDLGTRPGPVDVSIKGRTAEGDFEVVHRLVVLKKDFEERHLTVDEKYVTPPPEVTARIERESREVASIFARTTPEMLWSGPFERPVPGAASSSFGKRSILNGKPRSPHTGTDFRASEGTPIRSPNDGKVVLAKDLYFAGNTVIIDHGLGLYSYFAHLSEIGVEVGQTVSKGETVGLVGATGRVTGPHLHWTVRLLETRVDPLSLMVATDLPAGE
jgi:murein DD-endopeptidase MepM/ murein hydrolase activator NlpD